MGTSDITFTFTFITVTVIPGIELNISIAIASVFDYNTCFVLLRLMLCIINLLKHYYWNAVSINTYSIGVLHYEAQPY